MAMVGSLLSAIGGVLLTLVSAELYYYSDRGWIVDFGSSVPSSYQQAVNSLLMGAAGYYGLLCGIPVTAGAVISLHRRSRFIGGLISLVSSGLGALLGALVWSPAAFGILLGRPFPIAEMIKAEPYALPFFLGVTISIIGGLVTIVASKHSDKFQHSEMLSEAFR